MHGSPLERRGHVGLLPPGRRAHSQIKEKTKLSETENKQLLRRYYEEVLMQGRLDVLETIARADYVEHNPFPGHGQGLEGLRPRVDTLRTGLKQQFTLEHLLGEGQDGCLVDDTRHPGGRVPRAPA